MLLSSLIDKPLYSSSAVRGYCKGVGVSLKSFAVKYLLCASSKGQASPDFTLSISAVTDVDEYIRLSALRPLLPRRCARIFIGSPVYAFDGVYLGRVVDLELCGLTAERLFTDQNAEYPLTAITACHDAVILKKEQPFPIGQRIPAPFLSSKKEGFVTKPFLKERIKRGELIALTSALLHGDLVFRGKL